MKKIIGILLGLIIVSFYALKLFPEYTELITWIVGIIVCLIIILLVLIVKGRKAQNKEHTKSLEELKLRGENHKKFYDNVDSYYEKYKD